MSFLENALAFGYARNVLLAGFQFVASLAKHGAIIGGIVTTDAGRDDVIEMIVARVQRLAATVAVQAGTGERDEFGGG